MMSSVRSFFWLRHELVKLLEEVYVASPFWSVYFDPGKDSYEVDIESLIQLIRKGEIIDNSQIYIGLYSICVSPIWRRDAAHKQIDFANSYAVQIIPASEFEQKKILSMGQIAIMAPHFYADIEKYKALRKFYLRFIANMKNRSSRTVKIFQTTKNGERKCWPRILVSDEVSRAHYQLKQFVGGEVVFDLHRE